MIRDLSAGPESCKTKGSLREVTDKSGGICNSVNDFGFTLGASRRRFFELTVFSKFFNDGNFAIEA